MRAHGPPCPVAEPISARQPALRPHVHKQPEKTTRVRTVLNEKQLHTLRTCYAANPRPDALMKEQLVEMTGLSPRVIRVWFQNKRCKDKKRSIMMKQLQQQQPNDKTVSSPRQSQEGMVGKLGRPGQRGLADWHLAEHQRSPCLVRNCSPIHCWFQKGIMFFNINCTWNQKARTLSRGRCSGFASIEVIRVVQIVKDNTLSAGQHSGPIAWRGLHSR